MTAAEASRLLDEDGTTPVELVEMAIEATEKFQPEVNAYITFCPEEARKEAEKNKALLREHNLQQAVIDLKKKYGKNTIIKGTNLQEGATGMERNRQVGGHKA